MKLFVICCLLGAATMAGCGLTTLKVQPVTVEPIHMTIDVNVHDPSTAKAPATDEAKPSTN
jgi:arginase family enzyme